MNVRTTATLLALTGLGVAGGSAVAAPAGKSSPPRFHVYGAGHDLPGTVYPNASLTVDKYDDVQVLGFVHTRNRPAIEYFTKTAGTQSWHVQRLSNASSVVADPAGELVAAGEPQGRRLVAVYADCNGGVWTTAGSGRANSLPDFTSSMPKQTVHCNTRQRGETFVGAAAGPGDQAYVLLDKPDKTMLNLGVPEVAEGHAGSQLDAPKPLPNPENLSFANGATSISSDVITGELTVVATRVNQEQDFEGAYVWNKKHNGNWSKPHRIIDGTGGDVSVETGTPVANSGRITIPILKPGKRHSLFVIDRDQRGKWTAPTRITGAPSADASIPQLATNRRTLSVHAIFVSLGPNPPKTEGMFQLARVNGKWGHLRRLVSGDASPGSVGVDKRGHPIVGYSS